MFKFPNNKLKMEPPLLSIVVPVYGVEKYIEQCARSLLEQTYSNIEYIFVNDCTKDHSIEVLSRVLQDYPQRSGSVQIINNLYNKGLAYTRMVGFKAAKGEYLASCDSDDFVDLCLYEKMMDKALSCNSDIVGCDICAFNNEGRHEIYRNIVGKDPLSDMMFGRLLPFIPTCIFRSKLLKTVVLPAKDMAEDLVYSVQLYYYAKGLSYIDDCTYYNYRHNPDSISKDSSADSHIKRFDGIVDNTNQVISFLTEKKISSKYSEEIIHLKHVANTMIWPIVGNRKAYRLWMNTYPEIIPHIIFHGRYSWRTRFLYLMTFLGLYPLYKSVRYHLN